MLGGLTDRPNEIKALNYRSNTDPVDQPEGTVLTIVYRWNDIQYYSKDTVLLIFPLPPDQHHCSDEDKWRLWGVYDYERSGVRYKNRTRPRVRTKIVCRVGKRHFVTLSAGKSGTNRLRTIGLSCPELIVGICYTYLRVCKQASKYLYFTKYLYIK